MSAPDASHGEMPGFPLPGRSGPEADDLLGMILDGQSLPPDAPEDMHALAETLATLAGPAGPDELAGEAAVRAAVTRKASPAGVSAARPARRKPPRRAVPPSTRVAAGLVAAAIGLGGTAAAAYTGQLPGPAQDFAHRVIHAPPAHHPEPYPDKHKPGQPKPAKPTAPASPKPAKAKKSPKSPKPPKLEGSPKPAKAKKSPKSPKPPKLKESPKPAKPSKPEASPEPSKAPKPESSPSKGSRIAS